MKCGRELKHKTPYFSLDGVPPIPCLEVILHNPQNKVSAADTAEVDTGFDYGVLLTREIVDLLELSFKNSEKIIMPDKNIVTCGVAEISIKIGEKWFKTKAHYSEDIIAVNPILGRDILNKLNICLRGEEGELFIT